MTAHLLSLLLLVSAEAEGPRRASPTRVKPVQAAPNPAQANEAFVQGDYQRAEQLYTALLASPRLTPEARETVHLNRGYSNLRLNRLAEAASDLRQAVALNPTGSEAAAALHALQNRGSGAAAPSPPAAPAAGAGVGWGPLARLAGKHWIASTTKPVSVMRYEWGRVGVSMVFGGKDSSGNRVEGQYSLDPASNAIRVSSTYRGKTDVAAVDLTRTEFTLGPAKKKGQRQIAQLQPDGTFNIVTQKAKGKGWEPLSVATLVPATEQMVTALAWPDEPPPKKPSLMSSVLNSMKEGALEGLRDGTRQGVQDAAQYRVRQITGTKPCRTIEGEIVKCP